MTLGELLDKRLILLSGKGGVGKTTLAVALGIVASRLKKKTLLVEMNSSERVAPLFGLKEVGYKEVQLAPLLHGINLNPKDSFEEYVLRQIKFKALFDAFVNNRFITYFLNAVPGLNELLMIGKIYDLERQPESKSNKSKKYDLIIVDAPATGHGVSTFEVPSVVMSAVHVGPLKTQAENIQTLLVDKDKTAFSIVSLPEEMPVVEASELANKISNHLKLGLGPIFLNRKGSTDFTDAEAEKIEKKMPKEDDRLHPYFAYAKLDFNRGELGDFYLKDLAKKNPTTRIIPLPQLDTEIEKAKDLDQLVAVLEKELS